MATWAKVSVPSWAHLCLVLGSRSLLPVTGGRVRATDRQGSSRSTWLLRAAPRLLIMLATTLAAAGCRTANVNSIAHNRPPEVKPRPSFDLEEFVAEYNRNAEQIRSLKGQPSITARLGPEEKPTTEGQLDGRMAFERPRNFKLELSAGLKGKVADIGSNDEQFWFWVQNSKDKSVYVCSYDELGSTSLAVTYQPEWIIQAMGLEP